MLAAAASSSHSSHPPQAPPHHERHLRRLLLFMANPGLAVKLTQDDFFEGRSETVVGHWQNTRVGKCCCRQWKPSYCPPYTRFYTRVRSRPGVARGGQEMAVSRFPGSYGVTQQVPQRTSHSFALLLVCKLAQSESFKSPGFHR